MSTFNYFTEPVHKTLEVLPCKLCGSEPKLTTGSHGYCTSSIDISCTKCSIVRSTSKELNNGGENEFFLSQIGAWNEVMS